MPLKGEPGQPGTAQLLTLFCSTCGASEELGRDIPLVSVLRDTLGDDDPTNDKLTAVWLLSYSRPTFGQKAAAAVPFFYWRLGGGSSHVASKDTAPLLDLSAPERPSVSNTGRQILQWTALDTVGTPLRASSRAYRTNEVDHERLHLEEANTYLLRAPTGGPGELTDAERNLVVERLELRKNLLGGFVDSARATDLGKRVSFEREEARARNWELLRQCAEKTGLIFEPVTIADQPNQYGILWFPERAAREPGGSNLKAIWKLLNLKNPYADDTLAHWDGITQRRALDANGALMPLGQTGVTAVTLIPLGLYSLNYRREPLLMIDFRDKERLRRHELLQQSVNELTSGVIGLSRFANWYYFVGADLYNFYQGRHGKATLRVERLDCYSQFRVALTLDHQVDADLRTEMQRRVDALSINPLEVAPGKEMTAALNRYNFLQVQASGDDKRMLKRLDEQRREELASFGETSKQRGMAIALHAVTLGRYTRRVKPGDENLVLLDIYRRADYELAFLDRLIDAKTPPEVSYQPATIRAAVTNLSQLMPDITAATVRTHAKDTLDRLGKLSNDQELQANCVSAVAALRNLEGAHTAPGIVASPAVTQVREDLQ